MTLLNTTPDTFSFMVLGYAVILGTMALYILSLVVRNRRIDRELRFVEEIEKESKGK
jgi:hypothetical protein